jgi:hypothetical protein
MALPKYSCTRLAHVFPGSTAARRACAVPEVQRNSRDFHTDRVCCRPLTTSGLPRWTGLCGPAARSLWRATSRWWASTSTSAASSSSAFGVDQTRELTVEDARTAARSSSPGLRADADSSCQASGPVGADGRKPPRGRHAVEAKRRIYESTVYPGVTEDLCAPILAEVSGLTLNQDFFVGYSQSASTPAIRRTACPTSSR